MSGNKILITGGLGNLGSWISKYFASKGYDVYILTRKAKGEIPNINYTLIEGDICNLSELKEKLNFDIDYCIHAASYNEFFLMDYPKNALEINSFGTRNLLEVLCEKNIKNFIYISTFHVYGENFGIISEENDLNPKNDYASTHLFAEYYIKQFAITHKLKYTILRLTNSYGAPTFFNSDKWYLVINDLVKSAFEQNEILVRSNGKAKRDFIFMGDVSCIIEKIVKINATNDIYNLSANKTYEVLELANIVKKVYEKIYKKEINIQINNKDKSVHDLLIVKNDKLKSIIDFEINDKLDEEIENIFNLLEKRNG